MAHAIKSECKISSETQGQSVGSGEKAGQKFSSTGEKAPRYRLSPNYFQKLKLMPAPDRAQKMLCIIVPNRRTVSPESFSSTACACKETFFYFPNQKRRNYRWVKKTFGVLSAGAIQFPQEYSVFDGSQCIVNNSGAPRARFARAWAEPHC